MSWEKPHTSHELHAGATTYYKCTKANQSLALKRSIGASKKYSKYLVSSTGLSIKVCGLEVLCLYYHTISKQSHLKGHFHARKIPFQAKPFFQAYFMLALFQAWLCQGVCTKRANLVVYY